jgi:hypothetical protein|tara:strand:- start:406 stop:714 length:309 start_codon:yes stop_codon:yes gene_type:complete
MAIEKVVTYDYEVVNEGTIHHTVQIRRCDAYVDSDEPNVVLSSTFHRSSFDPESDWSSESDKVKAICNAVFTDEVKAEYVTLVDAIDNPVTKMHFAAKRYKD